ncbi:hypothetical protein [Oryzifoliimicrobium ureilyticus]|uniref:hypothetical protein n=1 Tax=Oryzifoliimicrobium ureilyticus TaxID=3113724 RepID=UPI0030763798
MTTNATAIPTSSAAPRESIFSLVLIGVGAVVLILLLLLFGGPDTLGKSAIGFDGLGVWLKHQGVQVPETPPRTKDSGWKNLLRIVPIYDNDLSDNNNEDLTGEERKLGSSAPRPLSLDNFEAKAASGPVLAVLPKWRTGFVSLGKAHPSLLIPEDKIDFYGESVARGKVVGLESLSLNGADGKPLGTATIYGLQVFGEEIEDYCEPLVSVDKRGAILAQCSDAGTNGESFFVLSDPDFLDNHGLALGDNAGLATKLIALTGAHAGGIYIDNKAGTGHQAASEGGEVPSSEEGEDTHQRSIADLSRFFVYPFSYVWAGLVMMMALASWRGMRRFGSAVEPVESSGASKRRTIEASGRILRLSGSESDLVAVHVQARLETLAGAILPARKANSDGELSDEVRIGRVLTRRSPPLARQFSDALEGVRDPSSADHQRFAALDLFERTLQEIWNEFGRSASSSRRDRR